MKPVLKCTLLALSLSLLVPLAVSAQPQQRGYAPEDLRDLSSADQVRVIGQEYSEQANGRRIPDDQLRFYLDQINRSDWTYSRIRQDIARSLDGDDRNDDDGYDRDDRNDPRRPVAGASIRCESRDNRQHSCATPWPARSQLLRQLSSTACVEGRTWGSQRGTVWVSGGCRAEFVSARQGRPPVAGNDRVTCESKDGRFKACGWNNANGKPQISRQLSSQPCVAGNSWGHDRRGLWVDKGCRAEFSTRRGPNPGTAYTVTCSSTGAKPTTCGWAPGYGRPQVVQQLSSAPCVEGRSWGYQGGASLWVSGGCRARFGVR